MDLPITPEKVLRGLRGRQRPGRLLSEPPPTTV
jgi:hypothetical protein